MNAQQLYKLENGQFIGTKVFWCSECRMVAGSEDMAEACCKPYVCNYCGVDVPRKECRTACKECIAKKQIEAEKARFEKAEKILEKDFPDEPIFCDDFNGSNEGFFNSHDDLYTDLNDEYGDDYPALVEEGEAPSITYVWTVKQKSFVKADVSRMLDSCYEDAYEDFDEEKISGIEELQEAADKFNKANERFKLYDTDYKKCVILEKPIHEYLRDDT